MWKITYEIGVLSQAPFSHRTASIDLTVSSLKESDGYSGHKDFVCVYLCTTSQLSGENVFLQLAPMLRVGIITTREELFHNRISTIWKKVSESFHMIDGMKGKLLMERF